MGKSKQSYNQLLVFFFKGRGITYLNAKVQEYSLVLLVLQLSIFNFGTRQFFCFLISFDSSIIFPPKRHVALVLFLRQDLARMCDL